MSTSRSQQKAHTRVQILRAAQHLFARNGFDQTRTTEIATLVGVSHGTIFAHFESKASILRSLVFDGCKKWVMALERAEIEGGTAIERLKALTHQLWEQHQKDTALTRIHQSYAWVWEEGEEVEFRDLVDRVKSKALDIISTGIANDEVRSQINIEIVLDLLEATYFEALRRTGFDEDDDNSSLAQVEAAIDYLLEPAGEGTTVADLD